MTSSIVLNSTVRIKKEEKAGDKTDSLPCVLYVNKIDNLTLWVKSKDFKNVYGGYGCFTNLQPVIGDKVAFILIAYNKKYRTNAVFSSWK